MIMEFSEKINELALALSKAQGVMTHASKDKNNPFFKSKYADLDSCWESCRKPLSENNLAVIQPVTVSDDGKVVVITLLTHESGQWVKESLSITPVKSDPQGIGSAITYGRRYGLMGMVGIAPAEDDGEAAMGRVNGKPNSIYDKIKALEEPGQFSAVMAEISQVTNQKERASLGGAFNARLKSQGIAYNSTDKTFSVKDLVWYQAEAGKQKAVMTWWKDEHGTAASLLSSGDMVKMERYVSQIFDIENEGIK
jgi:hypothetical protein